MNIKSMPIVASLMALCASATDVSYTYTPGETSLGDGVVTITYADETTDIATLTVTPTGGGTVALTGNPVTFADGATITLASSGTVSFAEKVTTLGALTLARSDGAYIVWSDTEALTENAAKPQTWLDVSDNGTLVGTDLEPSSLVYISTASICPGRIDRFVSGPSSNIFTLNRVAADHSYTFRPQISTSGIRCVTISQSQRFGYYPATSLFNNSRVKGLDRGHWCTKSTNITDGGERFGNVADWQLTKFMAAKKGMAALANVRFDGGVVLGGETSVAAGMEAVVAVAEGDNVISNAFTGDGDVRIVPMAPTAYTASHYFEPWITKTTWQVIATNRSLSALTSLAGKMQGKSHSPSSTEGGDACNAYHLTPNPADNTVVCQFQLKSSTNNKVVFAKLQQNGANVEIQAIKAGYVKVSDYPVGTDLTGVTLTNISVATSTTTSGYGIHMITATFEGTSSMGCVTLDGSMDTMVGNQLTFDGGERPLYVTVTSKTAFPTYGNVNVLTNADVMLHVAGLNVGTGISGGTSTLKVKRGGVLRRDANGQITKTQQVEVDGGLLDHVGDDAVSGGLYLNYLLLKDGARMTSGSHAPRSVYDNTRSYYNVVGSEPCSIEGSGIRPYGNSTDSTVRTFQINVNDVTGDNRIDCTVSKIQVPDSRFPYYHFEKYGDGTLKLEGSGKVVQLESTIYGGTFLLGASDSMTNAVVLAGGSIAVDEGKSNALGALTVSNACTIAVGEGGALSFKSFTAGEGLQPKAITIDAPLTGNVLRLGDGTTPLTSEQRAYFRWRDPADGTVLYRVQVDEQGYVHPHKGGTVLIVQ